MTAPATPAFPSIEGPLAGKLAEMPGIQSAILLGHTFESDTNHYGEDDGWYVKIGSYCLAYGLTKDDADLIAAALRQAFGQEPL